MAPRTDIFRPSAEGFDPQAFTVLGVFDLDPEQGTPAIMRATVVNRAIARYGARWAEQYGRGQCTHCGARIRYEALMIHNPTRQMITVGEQCLENRFDATAAEFAALRAEAARKAKITRERNARHEIATAAAEWLAAQDDPRLVELSYAGNGGTVDGNYFLGDVARKLFQYGSLSSRQITAVVNAVTRDADRQARTDARQAEKVARQATVAPAPTGRVEIIGTVGATWTRESDYGTQHKFRVITEGGYVVISTIPAKIIDQLQVELGDKINVWAATGALKDRRVRFTATLEPTKEDHTAAWAARPSKATLITV